MMHRVGKHSINLTLALIGATAITIVAVTDLAEDRFTAGLVILTLVATLTGLNMQWPRRPSLILFYKAAVTGDRNTLPPSDTAIEVWIENVGAGHAEAMEAEFHTLGGQIFGEKRTLGFPVTQVGPGAVQRWGGDTRVLNRDEAIKLVSLHAPNGQRGSRWASAPTEVTWTVRAKGMREKTDTIHIGRPPKP